MSSIMEDIKNRLKFLGYKLIDTDSLTIKFAIDKVENKIKNECSITEIPDGLYQVEIDRICGEFLFAKKQSGQLTEYDFEVEEKSIRIGDTTVDFATNSNMSPEANFERLLKMLMSTGESELVSYRKLRW